MGDTLAVSRVAGVEGGSVVSRVVVVVVMEWFMLGFDEKGSL